MRSAGPACVALVVGCLTAFAPLGEGLQTPSAHAQATPANAFTVGDQLEATRDVTLQRAEIRRGSRISVTRVEARNGRTYLDVELADGHVLRSVASDLVNGAFRHV